MKRPLEKLMIVFFVAWLLGSLTGYYRGYMDARAKYVRQVAEKQTIIDAWSPLVADTLCRRFKAERRSPNEQ